MSNREYLLYAVLVVGALLSPSVYAQWKRGVATPTASLVEVIATPAPTPTPSATPDAFTILLVPGHDVATGGARFLDVYERDLAVDLAGRIAQLLEGDDGFKTIITRSTTSWSDTFSSYFTGQEQEIIRFKTERQEIERARIASREKVVVPDGAAHTVVDKKTSIQLYGINKWANENDVDLLIHIHFNDSGRPNMNVPGQHQGFSLYIPEFQLPNAKTSAAIGQYVFRELKKNVKPEIPNPSENQSLIALGASGTLTKPSMLIEYAYMYEKPLRNRETRGEFLTALARSTVQGLREYLASGDELAQ